VLRGRQGGRRAAAGEAGAANVPEHECVSHGMAFARSSERGTLASGSDPSRNLGSAFVADALSVVRLAAAAVLPGALARGVDGRAPWLPAVLFVVAATTDFLDGPIARRGHGPTAHGAVLDNLADIAFVLAGTIGAAALGLVAPAVPAAIMLAFGAYALASLGQGRAARSVAGHAAGVLNYALAGLVTAAVARPGPAWRPLLEAASLIVVGTNLAAVLERAVALRSARGRRGAGRGARSPRSSA